MSDKNQIEKIYTQIAEIARSCGVKKVDDLQGNSIES